VQRVRSRQTGRLFTISPAAAVQITPTLSVGVAINIWPDLFDNGWKQKIDVESEGVISSGNRIVPFTSRGRIDEAFDFEGVNATIGFLWTINSIFTVGGVIRTPFTAKVKHEHVSTLTFTLEDDSDPVPIAARFNETLDMDMPLSYGLGVAAVFSDSLTVSLDVSRTHWSDFELEPARQANTVSIENAAPSGKGEAVLSGRGDDITSVRLGAEYQWILPRIAVPFRAGVFYDPEPGDGGTDDFFGFSLGIGLVTGKVVLDMAYTFRTGTIKSEANATDVYQHGLISSLIYHF
jgi:long-subunit fatty acid transport protein